MIEPLQDYTVRCTNPPCGIFMRRIKKDKWQTRHPSVSETKNYDLPYENTEGLLREPIFKPVSEATLKEELKELVSYCNYRKNTSPNNYEMYRDEAIDTTLTKIGQPAKKEESTAQLRMLPSKEEIEKAVNKANDEWWKLANIGEIPNVGIGLMSYIAMAIRKMLEEKAASLEVKE